MKLGDRRGRKVTEQDICKKILIRRFLRKSLQISPKSDTLIFGWLVGNVVFSETTQTNFLIFCIKLGEYKGRKVTEPDFWKELLIWRKSGKCLQTCPKSDTFIFFWNTAPTIFLAFGLKLVLNITFNLNETYLQENLQFWDIWPGKHWILVSRPNYVSRKQLIHLFSVSCLKLVFNYHFHMNVIRSTQKLPFPRILT